MEKAIKARLKKGWKPTKKQAAWIVEYIYPSFDVKCGFCMFNLMLHFGLIDV